MNISKMEGSFLEIPARDVITVTVDEYLIVE